MVEEVSKSPERVYEDIERREFDLEGLNFDGSEKDKPKSNPTSKVPQGAWTGPFTSV